MSLLVRAIVRARDAEHLEPGLVTIRRGEIAAVASPHDGRVVADEPALRAHHAIASGIHDAAPSLPSRFGQVFADETALASALDARRADLAEALERVGDRVEMSVTLSWRAASSRNLAIARNSNTPPATGRDYLRSRAVRERERQDAERAVERLVAALATERPLARHSSCPRDGVAAIVALLIDRDRVRAVRERIAAFSVSDETVTAATSAPMPPYTFTS